MAIIFTTVTGHGREAIASSFGHCLRSANVLYIMDVVILNSYQLIVVIVRRLVFFTSLLALSCRNSHTTRVTILRAIGLLIRLIVGSLVTAVWNAIAFTRASLVE